MNLLVIVSILALFLIETSLSMGWNKYYFNYGIIVFKCKVTLSSSRWGSLTDNELYEMLSGGFPDDLEFKVIYKNRIAFRPKWLKDDNAINILEHGFHGIITIDHMRREMHIVGYLKLCLIAAVLYFLYLQIQPTSFLPSRIEGFLYGVAGVLLLFAAYIFMFRPYQRIRKFIEGHGA